MRKIILILGVMVLSQLLLADATITFKETEVNFNETESGTVLDLNFEFENTGDSMLIIKNISTSCGCTIPKIEKKEYQPGEKGVIPVKFYTAGYSGRVIKTLTVATNDKKNVYTRLKITGNILLKNYADINLAEEELDYEEVVLGQKYTKRFHITNPGTQDLRIIEICHSPELSTEFSALKVKSGETGEILVHFTPLKDGKFLSFIKIKTNAYRSPLVVLRVKAEVEPIDGENRSNRQ